MSAEELATAAPMVEDDEAEYDFEDKEGVEKDLSGDGGCKKIIERKGQGWEMPEKGDEVTVHYVGTLLDGTQFDSSRDRGEPFTFKLGEGRVIKGWDCGVATMKKGELSKLICRSDYAYGAAGSPPTIPPDATLQFAVELISWRSVKDITGDGGVIKTVLSEGEGWQHPKDVDEVLMTFTARIRPSNNTAINKEGPEAGPRRPPVSAAEAGAPVVAASPEGGALFNVIDAPCSGFAVALKQMKVGEKALLLLSPTYAAGVADVAEGEQLQVEFCLQELHQVTTVVDGIIKKTLFCPEGSYSRPNDGSTVTITVTTKSVDGATVYEQQRELEYVTDEERVSEGLELAVGSMREGEVAAVTVTDPALAAPPAGALAGAGVPAGCGVLYDVKLVSFKKAKEKWEMNNAEKLASALSRKDKGNAAYKAGQLARAARQYAAAVETATSITEHDNAPTTAAALPTGSTSTGLPEGEGAAGAASKAGGAAVSGASLLVAARDVKKAASNNWAAVELKRGNWAEAAKQATKVLDHDPLNTKALYRRGSARLALGDLLEAELDVKAGLLTQPDNSDLLLLQRRLKVALRELNKKEAKLYGKMFAALGTGGGGGGSSNGHDAAAAANGDGAAAAATAAAAEPMQEDAPAAAAPAAAAAVEAAA